MKNALGKQCIDWGKETGFVQRHLKFPIFNIRSRGWRQALGRVWGILWRWLWNC